MTVSIRLISIHNTEEVLEFEIQNKTFFETVIPPRGDCYYHVENLKQIIAEI